MLTLRLDYVDDADLIGWIDRLPRGTRSQAVRQALRRGIGLEETAPQTGSDLQAIREIVADELGKVLATRQFADVEQEPSQDEDIEAQYGSKLDRLLGGFGEGTT